jgi:sugar lactone lactonase YvrE
MKNHIIHSRLIFLLTLLCVLVSGLWTTEASAGESTFKYERMWPVLLQPWYFNKPQGIAFDGAGYVYVADSQNDRIQKFSTDGRFVAKWGSTGTGKGRFQHPWSIAVDSTGNVYVTDALNSRVQKFSAGGQFLTQWGKAGSGDGQFSLPAGIAVDSSGMVYVSDYGNDCIQKFDSNGQFLSKLGSSGTGDGQFFAPAGLAVDSAGNLYVADSENDRIQKFGSDCQFLAQWGSSGFADGNLEAPFGIAVDDCGNIFVADSGNDRVQKFNSQGEFVTTWGSYGKYEGEFYQPMGLAVDGVGNVYVTDSLNDRIEKFAPDGLFLNKWGGGGWSEGQFYEPSGVVVDKTGKVFVNDTENNRIQKFDADGQLGEIWGGTGFWDGALNRPIGIDVDQDGNLYVVDSGNSRVQKFSSTGDFAGKWGSSGTSDGQFNGARGLCLDGSGNVYVADYGNNRIQKFASNGTFLAKWGAYGSASGAFKGPAGVAVDGSGNVYVIDRNNHRVQKFTSDGKFAAKWGGKGTAGGKFTYPSGIAVDSEGNIWVADTGNHRLQKFSSTGTFIAQVGARGSELFQFNGPTALAPGGIGRLVVADTGNHRIQVINESLIDSNNKAVILAGGGPYEGNHLWPATEACTNFAYRALRYQGFTGQQIRYLSSDTDLDLDGNGVPDVAGDATVANLSKAITQWALNADNVLVYLSDHGGKGAFRLNSKETLAATQLDGWLKTLEQTVPGKVIIVYDACMSGSFVPALASSSGKRVVITSTTSEQQAYFISEGGVSFSYYFWTQIFNGVKLGDAFSQATKAIKQSTQGNQQAMMDANGNKKANETEDFSLVQTTPVGNGTDYYVTAPAIQTAHASAIAASPSGKLYADGVTNPGNSGIARVWAVIRPPNYAPDAEGSPVQAMPTVDLTPITGTDENYEGQWDGFTVDGTYQLVFYAMDRVGNTSMPALAKLSMKSPSARKAIIVAGGTAQSPWPAIEKSVKTAYQSLRSQGYTADNIKFMSPVGVDGVTELPTIENLQGAIESWAATAAEDLVLYLAGDGQADGFQINANQTLSLSTLNEWLGNLQAVTPGKVTVVYDAPYAGSAVPLLTPPPGRQRIVIAGTGTEQRACFTCEGEISFSRAFWTQVANGANLLSAYLHASSSIRFSCWNQNALLDDDGSGTGNQASDGALARITRIGSGVVFASDPPLIGSVSPAQNLSGKTSAVIAATGVTSTRAIDRVWAVITPPDYSTDSAASMVTDLPVLTLVRKKAGQYQATYNDFSTPGVYQVTVYAVDKDGNVSVPKGTTVTQAAGMGVMD